MQETAYLWGFQHLKYVLSFSNHNTFFLTRWSASWIELYCNIIWGNFASLVFRHMIKPTVQYCLGPGKKPSLFLKPLFLSLLGEKKLISKNVLPLMHNIYLIMLTMPWKKPHKQKIYKQLQWMRRRHREAFLY